MVITLQTSFARARCAPTLPSIKRSRLSRRPSRAAFSPPSSRSRTRPRLNLKTDRTRVKYQSRLYSRSVSVSVFCPCICYLKDDDDDDDDDDEKSVSSSDGVSLGARKSREKRGREIVIAKPNRIFDGANERRISLNKSRTSKEDKEEEERTMK